MHLDSKSCQRTSSLTPPFMNTAPGRKYRCSQSRRSPHPSQAARLQVPDRRVAGYLKGEYGIFSGPWPRQASRASRIASSVFTPS